MDSSQPSGFNQGVQVIQTSDKFSTSYTGSLFAPPSGQKEAITIDCPQNDKEWCVDDQDGTYEKIDEADYIMVNLLDNTESYTAFEGGPIWKAIYEENCVLDKAYAKYKKRASQINPMGMLETDETCTEETLLNHLMSGLHASINTHVSDHFDTNEKGDPVSNHTYWTNSVGNHKDRVKNLYFIYAVVLKAVTQMEPVLLSNSYLTGLNNDSEARPTQLYVRDLLRKIENEC